MAWWSIAFSLEGGGDRSMGNPCVVGVLSSPRTILIGASELVAPDRSIDDHFVVDRLLPECYRDCFIASHCWSLLKAFLFANALSHIPHCLTGPLHSPSAGSASSSSSSSVVRAVVAVYSYKHGDI
jgi:hypothetical protein